VEGLLADNAKWMTWNILLALVPAAFAVALFRPGRRPSPRWWAAAAVFIAFLPNAPYVLTDVVHLPGQLRQTRADGHVVALLVQFGILWLIGFAAYVFSVTRAERWLRSLGAPKKAVVLADLAIHAVCAVGVVLGRIVRLNSWDVVMRPAAVVEVVGIPSAFAAATVAVTFAVLVLGTIVARMAAATIHERPLARG
jgi:uncharacterized membrane protein